MLGIFMAISGLCGRVINLTSIVNTEDKQIKAVGNEQSRLLTYCIDRVGRVKLLSKRCQIVL